MFTGNGQHVLVNSSMGQHLVHTGMGPQYIPPGEHQIQIVQGSGGGQYLQSGGNRIVVTSNPSVNCSTPHMAPANQNHPQLVATSSPLQQAFPPGSNPIQVVSSQVAGMPPQPAGPAAKPPAASAPSQGPRGSQAHVATTAAASPASPAVHQVVQFVTAGPKGPSLSAESSPEAGPVPVSASAIKTPAPAAPAAPAAQADIASATGPGSLPHPTVLVPFGWKRLQSNGSVFYIR